MAARQMGLCFLCADNADNILAPPGLDWEYMTMMKAQEYKLEPRGDDLFELIIIVSSFPRLLAFEIIEV
jgi:hypothetical protein